MGRATATMNCMGRSMSRKTYCVACDSFITASLEKFHSCEENFVRAYASVSCSVAAPETKREKAARLAKEARIEKLLAELADLGWEPPECERDHTGYWNDDRE